ncbi:unnamed protein product [Ambrosiozyma monospora]|uniref:Unnamed protein product n=1 Tax=Ambrosiozyma monospora TaxID=43982 RepID=A0ACB5U0W0_AMBMO|nr:unnamed protein product [Ambrosiozyma monospora]
MSEKQKESDSYTPTSSGKDKDLNKSGSLDVVSISSNEAKTELNDEKRQDIKSGTRPELAQTIAGVNADDLEFIMDKVDRLSLDEALEIMTGILEEHKNDINFEKNTYERMQNLLKGPEAVGLSLADYEYEVKVLSGVCKFFSPYPEVRSVTKPYDDPSIPVETIRAYFLGFAWSVIGQYINSFFNSRFPSITLSSPVCQTLIYPCGKFLELVLPDWGFNLFGIRHSLNPGPWSYKEQMFSTIIFNVALGSLTRFY